MGRVSVTNRLLARHLLGWRADLVLSEDSILAGDAEQHVGKHVRSGKER
jgi:hypothetical protein